MTKVYHVDPSDIPPTKFCIACEREQASKHFHRNNQQKDGLHSYCKSCVKKKREAYEHARRESKAAYQRDYQKEHKEQHNTYQQGWSKANYNPENRYQKYLRRQDTVRIEQAIWREKNRENTNHRRKVNYWNNPQNQRQRSMKRWAIKKGATIGTVDYDLILVRDGLVCHICGGTVSRDDIQFDHVVPLTRGGDHSQENIKVSHSLCNRRKSNLLMEELTPYHRRGVTLESEGTNRTA